MNGNERSRKTNLPLSLSLSLNSFIRFFIFVREKAFRLIFFRLIYDKKFEKKEKKNTAIEHLWISSAIFRFRCKIEMRQNPVACLLTNRAEDINIRRRNE